MSKSPLPEDDDLPPPYTAAAASPPGTALNIVALHDPTSLFAYHLTSLKDRIALQQAGRISDRDQGDNHLLALLVPHVEEFLSSISEIHPPPVFVEATIVPFSAVGQEWELVHDDDRRQGELRKVIRVERHNKLESDRKSSEKKQPTPAKQQSGADMRIDGGFDGWGRWNDAAVTALALQGELWWSDEAMASRLSKYLEPDRPTASVDRQTVQAYIAQKKEDKKASKWGMFSKSKTPSAVVSSSNRPPVSSQVGSSRQKANGISMTVRAENTTFRSENAFGVWESKSGSAIKVRVRIRYD